MSTSPDFDLEKLFLPAWAQEAPSTNRYENHRGDDRPDRDSKFGDRRGGSRPPRRDGPRPSGGAPGGPGRDQNRGPRPGGPRPGGPAREGDRPQRAGGPGGPGGFRGGRRDDRGDNRGRDDRREAPLPLPDLIVTLMPDDKGVESLSRQIKISGRSFPLFDIAQMILQKPERQQVRFETKKKPDGTVAQALFLCAVDDSLWLSEQEAVDHVLTKHFGMFYQTDKIATEPPKGTYTFVAQCGMSGVVLGPPNHHDYQNQLHKLHQERFSRMPFDAFKARVKIVREEAVVKKWIEEQSFKTEYVGLNMPEPLRLTSREAVNTHFREVHLPNIIKQVEKYSLSGPASKLIRSPGLQRLLRAAWDEQRRFPLQIATVLSQQFASHGLQFFKVNKTITHVSVARPHYLDMEATPVSEQVKKIVDFINAKPRATRRLLVEALAPTPAAAPVEAAPADSAAPATPPAEPPPTPEQASIIGDLHWLIHQGHVIEFANGVLETAKKPIIKPPKPRAEPKPAAPVDGEKNGTAEVSADQAGAETADVSTSPEAVVAAPETVNHEAVSTVAEPPVAGAPVAETPAPIEPAS